MNTQRYTFHIDGMHCKACALLIEDALSELSEVSSVEVSLSNNTVALTGQFNGIAETEIAKMLTTPIIAHGYTILVEKNEVQKKWSDFKYAVPIALGFIFLFIFLQKAGIVHLVGMGKVTYGTAFVVGIVASLSTCMAVVGGLLLSMSATFAKQKSALLPQTLFHVGRIVSFFVLGGVIGAIGNAFTLSTVATFVLGMVIGLVMLMLGVNLLDVFHGAKKFQIGMPKIFGKHALGISKFNHTLTPLLVGIVTFFLPCGFTQSMQLYTLSTGGFMAGGLTMLSFALGTFPILALISVSSFSIQKSRYAGVFFKTAGLIVIAFALMNIINSLVVIGILSPVFNF